MDSSNNTMIYIIPESPNTMSDNITNSDSNANKTLIRVWFPLKIGLSDNSEINIKMIYT